MKDLKMAFACEVFAVEASLKVKKAKSTESNEIQEPPIDQRTE